MFYYCICYDFSVPDLSELNSLSSLCVGEGDMAVWHTHLLRAARNSCSVRQRLVSALICAINDEECEFIDRSSHGIIM